MNKLDDVALSRYKQAAVLLQRNMISRIHVWHQKLSRTMAGKTLPPPQRGPWVNTIQEYKCTKKVKEKLLFFSDSVHKQVNKC